MVNQIKANQEEDAESQPPDKTAYTSKEFANRISDLDIIARKVAQGRSDSGVISEPLVNFWGVAGVGKSWLLQRVKELYEFPNFVEGSKQATCTVYYDFERETAVSPDAVIANLSQQISQALANNNQFTGEYEAFTAVNRAVDVDEFIDAMLSLTKKCVPILLFDTTELVEESDWHDLEHQLLEPLLESDKILVVVAGRDRIPRWRRVEVRRRIMSPDDSKLKPFDITAVVEQLEKLNISLSEDIQKQLFIRTSGTPGLTRWVCVNYQDDLTQSQTWVEAINNTDIKQAVINALRSYEESILKKLNPSLRSYFEATLPLRYYRIEAIKYMAQKNRRINVDLSDIKLLRVLRDLDKIAEFIWWNGKKGEYTTDISVRATIGQRLFLEDSQTYIQGHEHAKKLYKERANLYPSGSPHYLIEYCYHQAKIDEANNMPLEERNSGIRHATAFIDEYRDALSPQNIVDLQDGLLKDEELNALVGNAFRQQADRLTNS